GVKRIGEALVEAGLVSASRLEAALARQRQQDLAAAVTAESAASPEASGSLGSALLDEKLVARDQLETFLARQIQRALVEMLTWKEGAFSFHPGSDHEPPPISFSLQEIVLDLVRISDERKHAQDSAGH